MQKKKNQLEEQLADETLYTAEQTEALKKLLSEQKKLFAQERTLEETWLALQE